MRSPPRASRSGPRRPAAVVRRNFALPVSLVEKVAEAAPPEYRGNPNAVVRTALEQFVRTHRRAAFESEMALMAADPQVRAVNSAIRREFRNG